MKSLAQLKAENERIKTLMKKALEMKRLISENKKLLREQKYGSSIGKAKKVGKVLKTIGNRLDRFAYRLAR